MSQTITGIMFARELGIELRKIKTLGQALLLQSIGLSKLKPALLIKHNAERPTEDYQNHVVKTLNELRKFKTLSLAIYTTVENQCERFDGQGFPLNKAGKDIPILSQIMSIVSYYENLVAPINQSKAISSSDAMSRIFAQKGKMFEPSLAEAFIKSFGIYPTGSVVELSDSSKAVVIEQNKDRRLNATVALVENHFGAKVEEPKIINLADKKLADLTIKSSLPMSEVDSQQFRKCSKLFNQKRKFFGLFG
jgi:HD-GYP domain-containing protein (c-di-GMP phosphodiesterase class II)